jgi:hypothetical protein
VYTAILLKYSGILLLRSFVSGTAIIFAESSGKIADSCLLDIWRENHAEIGEKLFTYF